MFKGGHTLNLDTSINNNVSSPKGGDQSAHGVTSPMNRFNNNPFLTIKHRSLSATKRMEQTLHMESHKESEAELLTPTSISMKNTFIIKNANDSFDANYKLLPKTKAGRAIALTETPKLTTFVEGNRPTPRDGHSAIVDSAGFMYVFGGDRHHMPFNDLYMIRLE